ncbi:MAG: hypothetical protein ABI548_10260 [Polyangiaceae bacterium]
MTKHTWNFARIGGFDQVELSTGEDLIHLGELDQKLWVALACPVKGIVFDERTLELIDIDKDGRVRAGELIAAVEWAGKMLEDTTVLAKGADSLPLAAINNEQEESKLIRKSARAVLASIEKKDAKSISVADTANAIEAFNKRAFNGDGVITVDSASEPTAKKLIEDVLACTAPVTDKSGAPGITAERAAAFLDELAAHAAWLAEGEADEKTRPFEGALEAYAAVSAVRAKVDDFFARTKVAAFDPRALTAVNREENDYLAIAAKDLDITAKELTQFPLARISADSTLPLERGVNPAWRAQLAELRVKAIKPAIGDQAVLTEADWRAVLAKLEPYHLWFSAKKGASVEKLGATRVKELASPETKAQLDALFEEEKKAEPLAGAIQSVERLVRYARDLLPLANNFVSFRDFYAKKTPATFQVGTLYLDQRACSLCVPVLNAARHATMAPMANIYLLYCDLKNAKGETMSIAAAVTGGDVDNLMVGRNGIFYDRKGGDWDATISKIVDNPISIRQAFWSPYKKVIRMIEEQVAKRAAAAEAAADAKTSAAATHATAAVDGKAEPAPPPADSKIDIGTVAALGVAVGGITAAFGVIMSAFFGLGLWMPLGLLGLMLAISGPAMAVAWLKLRKRNLGPLLDANGWAVNAMAKLNVPFGGSLTTLAVLPAGSTRTLTDPYEQKSRPWGLYLVLVVILTGAIAWYLGKVDRFLPEHARSTSVLGANAPARSATPASAPSASH